MDRKPEELDAVANELLSEFVLKKADPSIGSGAGTVSNSIQPAAPISLSPLSSSSSSGSSSRSSRSSSSSSSGSSGGHGAKDTHHNEDQLNNIDDDDEELLNENSSKVDPACTKNSGNFVSVSNKSGTLIIRKDNNGETASSSAGGAPAADIKSKSEIVLPNSDMIAQTPGSHAFAAYNPNSKCVPVNPTSAVSTDPNSNQNSTTSNVSLGVGLGMGGALVQPLNEALLRKSAQIPQIVTILFHILFEIIILYPFFIARLTWMWRQISPTVASRVNRTRPKYENTEKNSTRTFCAPLYGVSQLILL